MLDAFVTPPKPSAVSTGNVVKSRPPKVVRDGNEIVFNCVNSVKVRTPEMDCNDGPESEVVAAKVVEPVPLLIISTFPVIVVIPPKLTCARVGEMTTSPFTFVQAASVFKSDAEEIVKVAEVHAGLADAVVVDCAT